MVPLYSYTSQDIGRDVDTGSTWVFCVLLLIVSSFTHTALVHSILIILRSSLVRLCQLSLFAGSDKHCKERRTKIDLATIYKT